MKLFITDYDGTLFTSEESIKKNILKLKELQKNDFIIVISTGRSYPSIKEQIKMYNIPYDYLTCADGSVTFDNKGNLVNCYKIDKDIVKPFMDYYKDLNYEEIQFSYTDSYQNQYNENKDLLGINICISTRLYTEKLVKSFYKLKKKYRQFNYLAYSHPNYSYLCVKPVNISKSSAVSFLAKELNIKKHDIYLIGDSSNDLEMLKDFKGVCMTNSYPDILKNIKKRYNEVSDYIDDILNII